MKFMLRNYVNNYSNEILELRRKILKSKFKPFRFIMTIKYERILFKCQSFFPINNKISNNITFPHGLSGIFISNEAVVGDNCVIFQQVTIGSNTLVDSKSKGAPIVGKNVYIGAGAKIIGNVIIGDNARIGANTVVTKNIPNNCTVVGSPVRIITHDKCLNNKFLRIDKYKEKDFYEK